MSCMLLDLLAQSRPGDGQVNTALKFRLEEFDLKLSRRRRSPLLSLSLCSQRGYDKKGLIVSQADYDTIRTISDGPMNRNTSAWYQRS